jgi:hypothetical protein
MARSQPQQGMGQVYLDANTEAVRRGDRKVSTEHVLLALLADPDSTPARALGVSLEEGRGVLERLDRTALAAAGRDRIGSRHVLLGLLDRTRPDPAAVLLDALGVDRTAVRTRLERV